MLIEELFPIHCVGHLPDPHPTFSPSWAAPSGSTLALGSEQKVEWETRGMENPEVGGHTSQAGCQYSPLQRSFGKLSPQGRSPSLQAEPGLKRCTLSWDCKSPRVGKGQVDAEGSGGL